MAIINKFLLPVIAAIAPLGTMAQTGDNERFAVHVHARAGLDRAFGSSTTLPGTGRKSTLHNFGADFGWKFWQRDAHSLEAVIGVGYSPITTTFNLGKLEYSYAAPATADEDADTYIRHYRLSNLKQRVKSGEVTLPLYAKYAYRCTEWMKVYVDLGLQFGIGAFSKVTSQSGETFSYGVYPQYDNLMIDADYLNDFGSRSVADAAWGKPRLNPFTASLLVGFGAEARIYGPFSAALGFNFIGRFNNVFKSIQYDPEAMTEATAPLTYTVKDGSRLRALTDYLGTSKLSQFSLTLSLIYHF